MSGSDILSQEEIDALLNGMDSGDVEVEAEDLSGDAGDGVRTWDFAKEERIVRGRMPALEVINERFARALRAGLFNQLRRSVEIVVDSVKMQKFSDYGNALFVPASISLIKLEPLRGQGLLVLDPKLVFLLVESFFGGDGRFPFKIEGREFTATELRVIELVVERALRDYAEAWEILMDITPNVAGHEVNPQLANVVTRNEVVVVSTFRVEVESAGGALHLTLPYSMLEPIRGLLDSNGGGDRHNQDSNWNRQLRDEVMQAEVDLTATLPDTRISLRKLANMKPGDVIPIESPDEVYVYADDLPVMRGRFGLHNGNAAVKIERLLPLEAKQRAASGG